MEDNIYSLFMAEDEPTAQEKAMRMAAALRKQDIMGTIAAAGQNNLINKVGTSELGQVKAREEQMADAGKNRLHMSMEREKAKAKGKGDALSYTQELRKELMGNQVVKDTQQLAAAHAKMKKAFATQTAGSDMGMIYGMMKMYDPGSTVREGEYATAEKAGGVPAQLLAMYNRLVGGGTLKPSVRADFMKQADQMMQSQVGRYKPLADEFGRLAEQAGTSRGDVVLDLGFEDAEGAGPSVRGPAVKEPGRPDVLEMNGKNYLLQPDGTYLPE